MKQKETLFKERFLKVLRKLPFSWFEKIQQKTIRGTPDILGCVQGKFIAIELKTEKGKTDPLQDYKLSLINDAGGYRRIATPKNADQIIKELEKICKK